MWILIAAIVAGSAFAQTEPDLYSVTETRYCGPPKRDADGRIIRSSRVTRAFQKHHKCPTTGLFEGACPGFLKDHVIPLACGGCDSVSNMQWLDTIAKRRKDSYELEIYEHTPEPYADTAACKFKLQPMP